ncbi:Long-chain-fatty-acid--CoA ligase 2 [Cyberlindnera fabianii]|uniref:Long-chain-fatty-acid--CoA ligase 2 n=1 Tax=Cyberlindnera fabianii TaxID=36022 RepID=A0A1V2LCS9_CYBFA|nr:Long-chain-fatty-acid--CoA ligase 2 [Cyberlindnera fabianii]
MTHLPIKNYESITSLSDAAENLPYPFEETDHSVALPGTETAEYSPVFRNGLLKGGELAGYIHDNYKTFYHLFEASRELHKNKNSIGYRKFDTKTNGFENKYTWESYEQLAHKRDQAGAGFLYLVEKYAPKADPKNFVLTMFSANKPEWIIADLACHAYSVPNTPLYDTLGQQSTEYILKLTESPLIFLSKNKINAVFDVHSEFLKVMVSIEDIDEVEDAVLIKEANSKGIHLIDFKNLLEIGTANPREHIVPTPDTLYTITFTSGTTGTPKGVELRHSHISAAATFLFTHVTFPNNPVSLVFLPLAHVYERFKIVYELSKGGAIGFPHDPENPRSFMDDIKILKPTHMSSVPRLYNRIESGLKDKIKSTPGLKGHLLRFAVNYKLTYSDDSWLLKILQPLVLDKIKTVIGFDNLDFLISGGSPLAADSIEYLRKVLNCGFYQGYGSSETFGGIAITTKYAKDATRTGAIGVTNEFKLRNLPDMDYTYQLNRSGELLLRGPQIFSTYYKNPEATVAAVDKDGWFSTGDIAQIDEGGRIAIVDRVKNFFKLSQGEYIAAEKIENAYMANNPFISQIFAYGNSFEAYLVAIVGIEEPVLLKLTKESKEYGTKISTHEQLLMHLNDPDYRKFVLGHLNKNIAHCGLLGFEKIKNVYLAVEPFKIDDETITPTLKLKRPNAQKLFQKEIDAMYKEGPI